MNMTETIPLITVLMPAYNAARFIAPAVESVLCQGFTDFELLVVDDGSTDDTVAVVQSFTDARIRLLQLPHRGIAAALNAGLQEAKGKYIARFDADDICYPKRLQVQYDFLNAHPDYFICGCAADYITEEGEYVFTYQPPGFLYKDLLLLYKTKCPFIHSGVMYVKVAVLQAGGYNEHAHAFEDHLLWAQLLDTAKGCNIKEVLLQVRLNPQSVTIDERWRPQRFIEIKSRAIATKQISPEDGAVLLNILKQQDDGVTKEAAYHTLIGKKFLWDNSRPRTARQHLKKAIGLKPAGIKNYGLFLLSFFPAGFVKKIYAWLGAG
jgi:glycosyltransferase involved in cell wall biosynthesis